MKKILSTQCKNKVHTSCDGYLEYFPHFKGYKCGCECHSVKKTKPTPPVNESCITDKEKMAMHKSLYTRYGRPMKCEECGNSFEGKHKVDWALKTGRVYSYNRKDYRRLCRSCHRRYDLTPDKKKNALKNLWWSTHTIRHQVRGEEVGTSKLKPHNVIEIRKLYKKGGKTQRQIGLMYGVTDTVVSDIMLGKTWRHI